MKHRELTWRWRVPVAWLAIALFIAGCTSHLGTQTQPEPTASSESSGLEEVTVTGHQRSGDRARVPHRAPPPHPAPPPPAAAPASPAPMMQNYVSNSGHANALAHTSPGEEIWIIAQPGMPPGDPLQDDSPGSGAMVATLLVDDPGAIRRIPLPLKHTTVKAKIDGYISAVDVRQQFENPYADKIEVTYLFPLPQDSAVNEFVMIVGERRIRGILRKKEEAEAIYYEARRQGYQASLMVQHRPNVFEQKIANIEPGNAIDVQIRYFHTLAYNDGWYSFVFPTVVGPRFNPPNATDPIEASPRGVHSAATQVTYLRPQERSGHDIEIAVEIDAGVAIEELRATHQIVARRPRAQAANVALANRSTIPNRDFILDFKVAGETLRTSFLTHRDPESGQGYFTLMLYPPAGLDALPRQAMEMVFVIDTSGSMKGQPLTQAKDAVATALAHLTPADTFQIIRFSEAASQLGAAPLPATAGNIAQAQRYLARLSGSGGTMMIEGIKAALYFPPDPTRLRFVSFMTDGYIGNEADIARAVHEAVGSSRIFSFGVGSSVNRYLLERMAKEGRGAAAYLGPQDSGKAVMAEFFERISHPALTNLQIDWGGMRVADVYPERIPDMFVGRPVFVTGKFEGTPDTVTVSGLAANETRQLVVSPDPRASSDNANIAKIWARQRIADLHDRQAWQPDPHEDLPLAITNTALAYQLISDYTAFVAVDASHRTAGDHGTTVPQPVPVPAGVRYDTTVQH